MKLIRLGTSAVSLTLLVALAACSSGGGGPSGGPSAGSFAYGYSQPTGQNPWMNVIHASAAAVADGAGGKGTLTDAQLDPAKAVQQVGRFVNAGDKVIAVAPAQVPDALTGELTRAHEAGIATFALEWSYSNDPSALPTGPVDGQVSADRGLLAKEVAATVNGAFPGGAEVLYMGLPFPVASQDYFEVKFAEALGTSRVVANLDNPTDNAQGALGPLTGALAANPGADVIVTYNGPSALAAIEAVAAAGRTGKVLILNVQLDSASAAAVADGRIAAAWDLNPVELGRALGGLITAAGTGQPREQWAKSVLVPPVKYTSGTIGGWTDWEK